MHGVTLRSCVCVDLRFELTKASKNPKDFKVGQPLFCAIIDLLMYVPSMSLAFAPMGV